MLESVLDVLSELAYAGLAGLLTVAGLLVETSAVQNLVAGQNTVGLWLLVVGAVALYAGVELAREKALPRLLGE